ncbi:MAG: phosphoenolpyruvate--protein phosphotransferase [Clostridia bacterium]|nr:phosphoenolpyruvate--protein phosphotransferase [Clostridia bacterium]
MITIQGQGVCGGVAFGKLLHLKKAGSKIPRTYIQDTQKEWKRFEEARKSAEQQLDDLYQKAIGEVGEENAMIFEIHRMMLEDPDYLDSVKTIIQEQRLNAESAVSITADTFSEMFASMDNSYMQARGADVKDISQRILSILTDEGRLRLSSHAPVIIGAEDLAPSETVEMDKSGILAFVTEKGSSSSHTAILARTMNSPAVIGAVGIMESTYDGADIIVDGFSGKIYVDPDMQTVLTMQKKKEQTDRQTELLSKLKGVKPITKDGQSVLLYANIGSLSDMALVYANDGMGVGLFRSEFLYLGRKTYPSEEEQFSIYKSVLQKAMGKRVVIRTLDIGADKQADYFAMPQEDNPAMGVRAVRLCLTRPAVFKTQLRALYRASMFGKLAIMVPMITSLDEVLQVKDLMKEVREELRQEHLTFREDCEFGIMIETPAAAIICDKLAPEVDFFSIGTNDLTQYTLAVDRQNPDATAFLNPHHTAILRLIDTVIKAAHQAGIWAGICGELAGDLELTELFLAMEVDELSVSPNQILPLKQKILSCNISQIRETALNLLK